jgi:hypothetical protein
VIKNGLIWILIRLKGDKSMTVWITILLILILAEVWWFGIHCTTYLSDIRDSLDRMTEGSKRIQADDGLSNEVVDAGKH